MLRGKVLIVSPNAVDGLAHLGVSCPYDISLYIQKC